MKNGSKVTSKRKWFILLGVVIILALVVTGLITKTAPDRPTDLGSKLQYIGKKEFGCFPFPLSFMCPGPRYFEYFFATDISKEELKKYFSKGQYDDPHSSSYSEKYLDFRINGEVFNTIFYENAEDITTQYNLQDTTEPHLIGIPDSDYDLAKSAL